MKQINYSGSSKLISRIVHLLNRKAPLPLDGDGDPSWGTNGQVLTTDGTGATYWSAGGGSGDSVTWTQIQGSGTKIAEIEINGTSQDVYAPSGGGGSYTEGDGINISAQNAISVDTAFTEASTRANIASGDTLATIWGKIKKFFSDLKTVAFTGSYTDLDNKPTIPAAQIQSDWSQSDSSAVDFIKNKPTIPTDAQDIHYDNTQSGLTSTDVQDAIDAVEDQIANSSDAYSTSTAYSVGDYCIYNDTLYRCVTACAAASWSVNSSCFVADTVVSAMNAMFLELSLAVNEPIQNGAANSKTFIMGTVPTGYMGIGAYFERDNGQGGNAFELFPYVDNGNVRINVQNLTGVNPLYLVGTLHFAFARY